MVACRSDEYAKGQRAPISTSELLLGNGGAASAFKPVPPNSQLSQKIARKGPGHPKKLRFYKKEFAPMD